MFETQNKRDDEDQHLRYDEKYEEDRANDLFMIHGGKFMFIRFNPDKYWNSNKKRKNPSVKKRLKVLQKEVKKTNKKT